MCAAALPADDRRMARLAILAVAFMMLGSARCYGADLAASMAGIPIVGAMIEPPVPVPAYVADIGKPAPTALPESDPKTWLAASPATDGSAPDEYGVERWRDTAVVAEVGGTQAGWTEVCKKVSASAGAERTTDPNLGALACSANPTVTAIQRTALAMLGMRAHVALYVRGAPGAGLAAIEARQGELRVACAIDVIARQGDAGTPFRDACTKALATAYREGDAPATFDALGEAFAAVAAEIARIDPKTAADPAYFDSEKK